MTSGQKTTLALVMLFAVAAYARNKLQKIETHNGASPGVVTIKGDDFQVATGGSNGDCLVWDTSTDAGVAWDPTCGGGGVSDGDKGDITVAGGGATWTIDADAVTESDLKAVDAPADEECLTYESTVGDFEWQSCSGGAVSGSGVDNQVAVWSGASSLDGSADLTFDQATDTLAVDGNAIFNEAGLDKDFRWESDNFTHMIFGDASADFVGIGDSTPDAPLDVYYYMVISPDTTTSMVTYLLMNSTTNAGLEQNVVRYFSDAQTSSATAIAGNEMIDADGIGWDRGFVFRATAAGDDYTNVALGHSSPTARVHIIGSSAQPALIAARGGSQDAAYVDGPYHGYDTANGYVSLRLEGSGATYGGSDWIMYASAITAPEDFLGFYNNSATDGASLGYKMRIQKTGTIDIAEGIDGIGAVDLDYGSADITDHTFITDGTGDAEIVLPTDSIGTTEILDSTIREVDLMAVNAATDEYCLTYEATVGDFEWQTCGSGGGDSVSVDSAPTVDPDFQDGDVDFTYAAGVVTATVGCSQCVSYAEIQDVSATDRLLGRDTAGAGVIEEITTSAALDMITTSGGAVLYRGASWLPSVWSTNAGGDIFPGSDDAAELGSAALRWNELYVTHIDNNGGNLSMDASLVPEVDNTESLGFSLQRWAGVYTTYLTNDASTGAITTEGSLVPDVNNTDDLGSSTRIFNEVFSSTTYINNLDGVGAVDMDYGSADITDHTFTTDGTGDAEVVLPADSIGDAELNDNTACKFWPVDSIYISMSSTNPGTTFGCGTWSAFGAGRVPVSLDSGDTSWDTAGETGGGKTHNHTYSQIVNHTHTVTITDPGHTHNQGIRNTGTAGTAGVQGGSAVNNATIANGVPSATTGITATTANPAGAGASGTTNSDNGIAMPYIAVYMWRRTA